MALCRTNRALAVAALTGTLPLLGCSTVFDVPLPQAYTEACGEAEVAENTATPILRTDRQRFWTDGNIQSIETVAGGLAVVTARAVYLVPSEAGEVTASESSAWTVCQPDSPRCVIQGAWAFGGPRDWQREYLVGYPERVAVLSCDPDDSPHVAAAGEERAPCALRIRDVRRLSSRIEWGPETAARSEYLTAAAPARHGFVVGAVGVPGLVDGGGAAPVSAAWSVSAGRSVFASKLYVHPALPAVPFSLDAGGRADAGETPATQRAAGRWIDLARIEGEPLLLRTRPVVDTAARVESMAVKLVTTDAVYRTLIDISDSGSTESRPLDWERLLESLSAFGTRGDWTFLAERRCLSGMRLGAPTQGDACWVTRRNAAVGIGGTEAQAGRSLLVWIESGASPADAPYVHGAEIRDGRPAACARLLARLGAAPAAPVFGDSGVPDGARSGPVVDADTVAANERGRFELSTQRYRMVVGASELFVASPSELWRIPLPEDLRPGASQDPDAGALPAPQGPPR